MDRKISAWLVQAYTALGLLTGLFAMRAVFLGEMRPAFLWLAASVLIDATDGPMARKFRSYEVLTNFDGRKLDDIVDYLNYVLVPSIILVRAGLIASPSWLWAAVPTIASAYSFCRKNAKTPDGYFTGFPSYWNIVVLYMYILNMPEFLNMLLIALFAVLVFIPIRYIDPFKTRPLRFITAPFTVGWAALTLFILLQHPKSSKSLTIVFLAYPLYYLITSFFLNLFKYPSRNGMPY